MRIIKIEWEIKQEISKEKYLKNKKYIKREYGRNRYHHMFKEYKQRIKEYQKRVLWSKKVNMYTVN